MKKLDTCAKALPLAMAAILGGLFGAGGSDAEAAAPTLGPKDYFRIQVVDQATSRGIPLVKLTTLDGRLYCTDSAGLVAYHEPGWMDVNTWFGIVSDGYTIKENPLAKGGRTLAVKPGGSVVVTLDRVNIAQRLYRITGGGIYRDSVLLGEPVPVDHPLENTYVVGQDSTQTAIYKGRLFWAWGDTTRVHNPIGANFKTTCATSLLPNAGGLDPEAGINLRYFTQDNTVKPMVPLPTRNLVWVSGLFAVKDEEGREHLVTHFSEIKAPLTGVGGGLAEFNDEKEIFEERIRDPEDAPMDYKGYPLRVDADGQEYVYLLGKGLLRVKADYKSVLDRGAWEAYTCLKEGSRFDGAAEQLDRGPDGKLRHSWKKNTSPMTPDSINKLVQAGAMKREEAWLRPQDVDTGADILFHTGSIAWNEFRRRYVMVFSQSWGSSMLGEVWYAEAERPEGPWVDAKKIVTHDDYSFYNPIQHPYFAKDGGRVIYFEGTYTKSFTGNKVGTPRYEYNQIMYKLELDDPRLGLPLKPAKGGGG